MGRRKIEIQPITHERNRSVTFLKRKNGLFKKAYELGVLCSVDVAVIIFEERPGHELKLHSYSSCDIRDIVQRQIRFQGERDSRGPGDFSGAGAARFDDDGDDNEDGEEEEASSRPGKRKVAPAKLSMPADVSAPNTPDYLAHRNGLHLPMGGAQVYDNGPTPAIGSLMPVSNDRVSNLRSSNRASKRPRTSDSAQSRSRSPSLDQDRLYMLNEPHMGTGSGGRISTRSIRQPSQIHEQPGPPAMGLQHHQNPYHPSSSDYNTQQQHQYGPLFPIGGPGAINMGPPPPPRFEPQYDPALYQHQYPPSMIRQTSVPVLGNRDGGNSSQPRDSQPQSATQRERGGGEIFAAFLEADERSRQMAAAAAQRQQEQLNWPASIQGNATTPAEHVSNTNGNQPGTTKTATNSWFDIFSNASPTGVGGKMTWPRVPDQLESIGTEIAQLLASNTEASVEPRSTSGEGSDSTPVNKDGNTGKLVDDLRKDVKITEKERRAQDDPDETEKDAEGEDDVGADERMEADVSPAADSAPAMQTSSDELKPSTDTGETVDGTNGKAKSKTGKGRSKRATTSSRGRGKAKGS